jgi:hypothetical protein
MVYMDLWLRGMAGRLDPLVLLASIHLVLPGTRPGFLSGFVIEFTSTVFIVSALMVSLAKRK